MRVRRGRLGALIIPLVAAGAGVTMALGATAAAPAASSTSNVSAVSTPGAASPAHGTSTAGAPAGPKAATRAAVAARSTGGTSGPATDAAATTSAPTRSRSADSAGSAAPIARAPKGFYVPTGCNVANPAKMHVHCDSVIKTDKDLKPLTSATGPTAGLGPADIQSAYQLPSGGDGVTVAIVDALGDSHAEADLATYRSYYGLPACTTDNGCFQKLDQNGGTDYPADDKGWALETSLDLDAVSAACPACHIMLVEANSTSVDDLGPAVQTAIRLGAKYVSNSYGVDGEAPDQVDYDHYFTAPGVAVVAATGDHGYKNQDWPAANPNVIAAGGTTLTQDSANPRGWDESAWSDGGAGCSPYEAKPAYQEKLATGCANRAIADVSAVADNFAIYDSGSAGWSVVGGTSLSTPLIASMYALAGTPKAGTYPVTYPYFNATSDRNDLNDVTTGSDGTCETVTVLCTAGTGWDGPTGLGSPRGVSALAYVAQGTLAGRVRDQNGAPIAGAVVTATGQRTGNLYHATTDAQGAYTLALAVDDYTVTASRFGYRDGDDTASIADGQSATSDFTLAKIPTQTVSGRVVDGSGHGWPLYAKITIDGYPNGAVFTDPYTGRYSVDLPQDADYQLHVTPLYDGYQAVDPSVSVAEAPVRQDLTSKADTEACTAAGYARGVLTHFEGWSGTTPQDGWTITNADRSGSGWSFDDGTELFNFISTGTYALADPLYRADVEDTTLTSPDADLSNDPAPVLSFGGIYVPDAGTSLDADVSLDGGKTWQNIWHQDTNVVQTVVSVPVPQAAGQPAVRVRFHYVGQGASIAELDDVSLGACLPVAGGLVAGVVSDANTHQPLNGVTVADQTAAARSAVTIPTPDDAGVPDGFYALFDTAGTHRYTATSPRYTSAQTSVTTTVDDVTRQDIALGAGRLTVDKTGLAMTKQLGQSGTQTVRLTNSGTAPMRVSVDEHTTGFTPVAATAPSGWQPMATVPEFMNNMAVTGYQGKVYWMGGAPYGAITSTGRSYVYDPATATWSSIAPLPHQLAQAVAAGLNGTIYVIGGADPHSVVSTVYAYHPTTDTWSRAADMPSALYWPTAATLNGKLYVIGGCASKCTLDAQSTAYSFDPTTNAWTKLADYPVPMAAAACAGIHDEVVCAGGMTIDGDNLTDSYAYQPASNSWTRVADLPYPNSDMVYSGANGRLQLAGGHTGALAQGVNDKAVEYDPVSNTWSSLPDAPFAFYGAGRGSCGLYQVGSEQPIVRTTATLPGYDQCGGDDDDAWLSESSTRIDLAPGASTTVTVSMDAAKVAQPGDYAAKLVFGSDTPYDDQSVPVTLHVTRPASWGTVTGTITDTTGAPVPGAEVEICSQTGGACNGNLDVGLTAGPDGRYTYSADAAYGSLLVRASKPTVGAGSVTTRLVAGGRVTADVTIALHTDVQKAIATMAVRTPRAVTTGTRVPVTVVVTAPGATPTGAVTVKAGALTRTATLSGGTATLTLPALAAGTATITATYAGDAAVTSAAGKATISVAKAKPTLTVALSKRRLTHRQRARVTATLHAPGGIPVTGKVRVTITKGRFKRVLTVPIAHGRATVRLPALAKGSYRVQVSYGGSAQLGAASATRRLRVTR